MKSLLPAALVLLAAACAKAAPGEPAAPPAKAPAADEARPTPDKPGEGAAKGAEADKPAEPVAPQPAGTGPIAAKGAEGAVPGVGLPPAEARALYEKLAVEKNLCPNGLPGLAGTWRFIGESKAVAFEDEIAFAGPDFTEWMAEGKEDARRKAIVSGRYSCIHRNRLLFQLKRVEPDGAFDNHSGDAYVCDVLSPIEQEGARRLLMVCFFDWKLDLRTALEFEYERKSD